jgi:tRNA nucleotidyltransferase (CCA-adding enzyme)
LVRDLLLGSVDERTDLDLVVEGSAAALARELATALGGQTLEHAVFLTATVVLPDGRRVDLASARRETYRAPGILPAVERTSLAEDLARRDFSVNAMALSLSPSAFGNLVDPCGGRHDLKRRQLRPLHPLSFVEDPTRIFRAARYAARLGLHLGSDGRTALGLALRIGDYPALSGQRLRGELDRLAREPGPWAALQLILRWKALRLWDRRYRTTSMALRRLGDAAHLQAWTRARDVALDPTDIALIALLMGQRAEVRKACLGRLAISGRRREILEAATARPLARPVAGALCRSEIAEALRPLPVAVLAGGWLRAERPVRRRIEWYLREGRGIRPLLSGEDVVACGVARGPAVGRCLAALSQARVDREVRSLDEERAFVRRWLADPGPMRARKEG